MGSWAKAGYGADVVGSVGVIVAGTSNAEQEKQCLSYFDEVISFRDKVSHNYLVRKGDKTHPLAFNVYGAPLTMDVLAEMHDGGCRNVIFVGYAYGGFKNLEVGSLVLVKEAYHFDGAFNRVDPVRFEAQPDEDLRQKGKIFLEQQQIPYVEENNISVPCVTYQMPHANEEYAKLDVATVEMELASFLSRAKDIGIRACGFLIISDNRTSSLNDEVIRKKKRAVKVGLLKRILTHLDVFDLAPLPHADKFSINTYLASVIHMDGAKHNVYRDGGK